MNIAKENEFFVTYIHMFTTYNIYVEGLQLKSQLYMTNMSLTG